MSDATGELFDKIANDPPEPEPEPVPGRGRPRKRKKRPPVSEETREKLRAAGRKGAAKSPRSSGTITPAALRKSLTETIRSTAGAMQIAGVMANPRLVYDAEILAGKAEELAAELVALAEKSPPMYAALVSLVKGSQWAKLGGLVVSIAVPIAANHGLLPLETATLVGAELPPPRPVKEPDEANANGTGPG